MSLLYKTSIPVNGEKLQDNVSGKFQYPRHYSFQNNNLFQWFWNEMFTSISASLICSVFVCFLQFNLEWKQIFREKKYFLHDVNPLLIFGQLSFRYLFSLLCSPVNYPLQEISHPLQKLWSLMLVTCNYTSTWAYCWHSASTDVRKTWLFKSPLMANSEGCQSSHSWFLLQFKSMFVNSFSLYLLSSI